MDGEDLHHLKSQLFQQLLQQFVALLAPTVDTSLSAPNLPINRSVSSMATTSLPLLFQPTSSMYHQTYQLVTQCLTCLLESNLDCGLPLSLSYGYHSDIVVRTCMVHVLARVVRRGAESDDFTDSFILDRYEKLTEMLIVPDPFLTLCLCDICPAERLEDLCLVLFSIFESSAHLLLGSLINREISTTESPSTLFRRTSVASKVLTVYAKEVGSLYLTSTLRPVFDRLLKNESYSESCEVDPTRMGANHDRALNILNLQMIAQDFIDAITSSIDIMPMYVFERRHD